MNDSVSCKTCGHGWSGEPPNCPECGTPRPDPPIEVLAPVASEPTALTVLPNVTPTALPLAGQDTGKIENPPDQSPPAESPTIPPAPNLATNRRKRLLLWPIATLILALVGAIAWLLPGNLPNESPPISLTLEGHRIKVYALAYTPDSHWLISAGGSRDGDGDHRIKVWEASTGSLSHIMEGHTAAVRAVAISPDGTRLASAGLDGRLILWNTASWQPYQTLETGKIPLYTAAFSPDGRWLVWAGNDQRIRRWDIQGQRVEPALEGHTNSLISLAFSPDGRWLASAGEDRTIRLWNTTTWQTAAVLKDHREAVWSLAFSPDGRWLASAGEGPELRVWNLTTRQPQYRLPSDQGERDRGVRSVAFSPNSQRLVAGNFDGSVKVWETQEFKLLLSYQEHRNRIYTVAYSPNGKWLAAAGGNEWGAVDYAIRLWPVENP